jgi:hypothetical protein
VLHRRQGGEGSQKTAEGNAKATTKNAEQRCKQRKRACRHSTKATNPTLISAQQWHLNPWAQGLPGPVGGAGPAEQRRGVGLPGRGHASVPQSTAINVCNVIVAQFPLLRVCQLVNQ